MCGNTSDTVKQKSKTKTLNIGHMQLPEDLYKHHAGWELFCNAGSS